MALTTYFRNAVLDHTRGGTAFAQPASLWVLNHTGDPGADATNNVATETTRRQVTFGAAVGGSMSATGTPVAEWIDYDAGGPGLDETVSHFSVWDAETGGNPLGYDDWTASETVQDGATLRCQTLVWNLV